MSEKIGIPAALMYHYYGPAWEVFFKSLGMKVLVSPDTNKKILDEGVKMAVDDICLPFKVYYGHVNYLLEKVDYLFVPRFISLGKGNFVCPKFMGLPNMLKAVIDRLPVLIEPVVDFRRGAYPAQNLALGIGRQLKKGIFITHRAYLRARKVQKQYEELLQQGLSPKESRKIIKEKIASKKRDCEIVENSRRDSQDKRIGKLTKKDRGSERITKSLKEEKDSLKIVVLGHAYLIYDSYISMALLEHLIKRGSQIYTVEMFEPALLENAARKQAKRVFWFFNRRIMGGAYQAIYNLSNSLEAENFSPEEKIDGIIQVNSFGCSPDSIIKELVNIRGKNKQIPVLNICLDEHSGQAGLITRLEAFLELLERRNWNEKNNLSPHG
ncbi:MAG TPA: acyl-CoA dehydratase activase-related protein [Halanaerobiales bacterium]|nr:acyl-CoA dehydratase activase-related protein [Halanaerobiales bacterium]